MDGTFDLNELDAAIPPVQEHLSQPSVVSLENSHNFCNGRVLRQDYIDKIADICKRYKLRMHLDGARILNASIFLKKDPKDMVKPFSTISFCMSKGLGCPVGSLVVGSKEDIEHARIIRKMIGGGMR